MRILRHLLLSICISLAAVSSVFADQPEPVNINTADEVVLSSGLKGIGLSKAKAIIIYRDSYGPFQTVDELTAVKGIGKSLVEKNRSRMTLK